MNYYFENGICVTVPMSNEEWMTKAGKVFGVAQEKLTRKKEDEMPVFSLNIDSIHAKGGQ